MKKILSLIAFATLAFACTPEEKVTPTVIVDTPPKELVISNAGGDVSVVFNANADWTASIKDADASSWAQITPTSGSAGDNAIKVIAIKNDANDNRVVTIVITAGRTPAVGAAIAEVDVTQVQKDALVMSGEKTFEIGAEGGKVTIPVSHNVAFEAVSEQDWLTNANTKAMQKTDVVFNVAPNTDLAGRSGTITISATVESKVVTEVITVNQAAFEVSLEATEIANIPMDGGQVSTTITANVEYTIAMAENNWLKMATVDDKTFTFTAEANPEFDVRKVAVTITPKNEAYAASAITFSVRQDGLAEKLWTKNPATIEGYNTAKHVRLAKYGNAIVLGNTNKAFLLNPADGSVISTFDIPGFEANAICVDDAGHIILANEVPNGSTMSIYSLADPKNPAPVLITSWDTANYYGANVGNLRVKGDITKNAVMSAVVSEGAGGALIMWEITNGVCGDWKWTSIPYVANSAQYSCAAPLGTKISDGFLYAGYAADYNIKYLDSPVLGAASTWVTSYTTGYSWMENINCITTCEYKDKKYAAFVAGCHFAYDDAEAILLDITDPASAQLVYSYSATYDVERNDAWANMQFSSGGAFSDILLIPSEDALLMVYVDSNYGSMACIAIK